MADKSKFFNINQLMAFINGTEEMKIEFQSYGYGKKIYEEERRKERNKKDEK